jgi:lysophospholipase L1-like esterase
MIFINGGKNGRKSSQLLYPLQHVFVDDLDGIILFIGVNDLNNIEADTPQFNAVMKHILNNVSMVIQVSLKRFSANNILLLAPCNVIPSNLSSFNLKHGYGASGCAAGLKHLNVYFEKLASQHFVHFLSLYGLINETNYVDGVHLNKAGYQQIASAISIKILSDHLF